MALFADRSAAGKNKYCEVPGAGEQLLETNLPHYTKEVASVFIPMPAQSISCKGWAIFVLDPGVRARVTHVKPDHVSHPTSVGRPG